MKITIDKFEQKYPEETGYYFATPINQDDSGSLILPYFLQKIKYNTRDFILVRVFSDKQRGIYQCYSAEGGNDLGNIDLNSWGICQEKIEFEVLRNFRYIDNKMEEWNSI